MEEEEEEALTMGARELMLGQEEELAGDRRSLICLEWVAMAVVVVAGRPVVQGLGEQSEVSAAAAAAVCKEME